MSDVDLLKLIGGLFVAFAAGGALVKMLVSRQFAAWDEAIRKNGSDCEALRKEHRVEFGSVISKIQVVEKDLGDDLKDIHHRVSELYKMLPNEYARLDHVTDLRQRITDMERKMEVGFDRLAALIKHDHRP